MQSQYQCPGCGSAIPLDDINVASDMALCRACGKSCQFSSISEAGGVSQSCLNEAPPSRVKIDSRLPYGLELSVANPKWIAFLILPFMLVFDGIFLFTFLLPLFSKQNADPILMLFTIPFLLGSLIPLLMAFYFAFGEWRLTMRNGEGKVFIGLWSLGWTRHFSYDRNSKVSLQLTNVRVNNVQQRGICISSESGKILFGSVWNEEQKNFVAAAAQREIQSSGKLA